MTSGIGEIDLKVAIIEGDRYALNAINAYLAWDRRTRVGMKVESLEEFWLSLGRLHEGEFPDVVILDANHVGGAHALDRAIRNIYDSVPGALVICLAQFPDLDLVYAAVDGGADAFLLKQDVRLHIAWAICLVFRLGKRQFMISAGLCEAIRKLRHDRLRNPRLLPGPRQYHGLSDRIREAIILFAVEGMPARLVADEMGISPSTANDYNKKANRILESFSDDSGDYPNDMSPKEIAFMRITALAEGDIDCDRLLRKKTK